MTRAAAARLFHPRPFRAATPDVIRRSSDGPVIAPSTSLGLLTVQPPPVQRSNSAPIQPGTEPVANISLVTGLPEGRQTASPEPQSGAGSDSGNGISPGRFTSRINSFGLPSFPRRSTEVTPDILTDPESTTYTTPRTRSKQQRLFGRRGLGHMPEEGNGFESESGVAHSGTNTPIYKRRPAGISTNNLRLRLPPPMREHFANGWPHAGSWQDALRYGVYEDEFGATPGAVNRGNSGSTLSRSQSAGAVATMAGMNGNGDHSTDTSANEAAAVTRTPASRGVTVRTPPADASIEEPEKAKRKSGRRKTKRYRPVLAPPTPGGNFVPREKVPGSAWGANVATAGSREQDNPFERTNPFERIDEELSLSPQPTHSSEKPKKRVRNNCTLARALLSFFFNPRRRAPAPVDDLDFSAKLRRMLFLDARVTIYIRLFNLGVVATLLGLAVTIRNEQQKIGASGSIGPSTTLIIAYSSFTMVHVLLAMYREYFGRPIGLWGLRSKMLWVCLDLLFVALWSSATTLAINDYIDTPLDCSPIAPWWTYGHDDRGVDATVAFARRGAATFATTIPESVKASEMAADVCRRQAGVLTICLIALLLYCGNMVLSLFRIFETVRRTANPERTVSV
ncbi:hypothetical protein Q8F55_001838 [Vanrija albida]|uniref:MARVEL domain-containing protein n=1 Tax=Vanrija albida TaxID=181172 RepID=A0ABR3Q822_9TREE